MPLQYVTPDFPVLSAGPTPHTPLDLWDFSIVREVTSIGMCGNCGATEAVGAIHVFRGAGIVLRCPHCDNALVKIVRDDDRRVWISFRGVSTLEIAF